MECDAVAASRPRGQEPDMLVVSRLVMRERLEQTCPAWRDELAAASNNNAVASWKAKRRLRDPDLQAHRAGRQAERQRPDDPQRQPQRDAAEPPTARVIKLTSCAIAHDGASTLVASAIATGNASSTASVVGCPLEYVTRPTLATGARSAPQRAQQRLPPRARHRRENHPPKMPKPGLEARRGRARSGASSPSRGQRVPSKRTFSIR